MFYSKTTNSFYDKSLKNIYESSGTWPDDAFEISEERYNELIEGHSQGKLITADENGYPILTERPEPSLDELKRQALAKRDSLSETAFRKIRILESRIKLSSHDQGNDDTPEKRNLTAWETYLINLDEIEEQQNFPNNIDWPLMPS